MSTTCPHCNGPIKESEAYDACQRCGKVINMGQLVSDVQFESAKNKRKKTGPASHFLSIVISISFSAWLLLSNQRRWLACHGSVHFVAQLATRLLWRRQTVFFDSYLRNRVFVCIDCLFEMAVLPLGVTRVPTPKKKAVN